jgi:hypothetical protein
MNTKILSVLFSAFLLISFTGTAQKWERLGSRKVNYGLDKDVIPVGVHEGAFTKLRIVVKGGAVNMHKMKIEYMNGEKQEVALRHNFSSKSASRIIDLKGNKRIIKKITFFYDTKNLARKRATVHVFGRH